MLAFLRAAGADLLGYATFNRRQGRDECHGPSGEIPRRNKTGLEQVHRRMAGIACDMSEKAFDRGWRPFDHLREALRVKQKSS